MSILTFEFILNRNIKFTFSFLTIRPQYMSITASIETMSKENVKRMVQSLSEFSEYIILSADKTKSTFPFVSIEYFESRARNARDQAYFDSVTWMPLVRGSQESEWANYSMNHLEWIYDSRNVTARAAGEAAQELPIDTITPYIYVDEESGRVPVSTSEAYLPIFMVSPPPQNSSSINEDALQYPYMRDAFDTVSISRGKYLLLRMLSFNPSSFLIFASFRTLFLSRSGCFFSSV